MRKLLLLLMVVMFGFTSSYAQKVPSGMKYQAVARNTSGEVLANRTITIRIELKTASTKDSKIYYSEEHSITTNSIGLFDLVVGEGKTSNKEKFSDIPWSTEDIWMAISLKDKGVDFSAVSESRLLAVPYAFHAGTASKLVYGEKESGALTTNAATPGVPANVWSLQGNYNSDPTKDKLGTTDYEDLVFVTNNLERLRITKDGLLITPPGVGLTLGGNLQVQGDSTKINKDLYVGRDVILNYLPWDLAPGSTPSGGPIVGQTINRGNFTVSDMSSTNLTGSLTAEKLVRFNDATTSTSATTGAQVVTGGVGIGENLNVGGITNLLNETQSNSIDEGSLIVEGGVGIEKNINVGGNAAIGGETDFGGIVRITDPTESTMTTDGALIVTGGTGIGKNLNVGGKLNVTNSVADGDFVATFVNTDDGNGDGIKIKLGKKVTAFDKSNALALLPNISSNLEQLKDLVRCDYTGSKIDLLKDVIFDATIDQLNSIVGIAIGAGNFMIRSINGALGLPYKIGPYSTPAIHIWNETVILPETTVIPGAIAIGPLAIPALDIPSVQVLPQVEVMPELPPLSVSFINGLLGTSFEDINLEDLSFWGIPTGGFCLTDGGGQTPLNNENDFISFNDVDDFRMGSIRAVSLTNWASNYLNPIFLFKLRGAITSSTVDKFHAKYHFKNELTAAAKSYTTIGVEYTSGNGDYAEWLERMDTKEVINAGDIVGVIGGKITKDLECAEQVMVVSHNPIVLGNRPAESKNYKGNNIAFMGQVPVKIMGPVVTGDYIVGQSVTPGYGRAVHPDDMTVEDFKYAVGRSWENYSDNEPKMVNTVVGIHNGDYLRILKNFDTKINQSETRLDTLESKVDELFKIKTTPSVKKGF